MLASIHGLMPLKERNYNKCSTSAPFTIVTMLLRDWQCTGLSSACVLPFACMCLPSTICWQMLSAKCPCLKLQSSRFENLRMKICYASNLLAQQVSIVGPVHQVLSTIALLILILTIVHILMQTCIFSVILKF